MHIVKNTPHISAHRKEHPSICAFPLWSGAHGAPESASARAELAGARERCGFERQRVRGEHLEKHPEERV